MCLWENENWPIHLLHFDPKLDPYIYQKSKICPDFEIILQNYMLILQDFFENFAKIGFWKKLRPINLGLRRCHSFTRGVKMDPIPRHIPNTSIRLISHVFPSHLYSFQTRFKIPLRSPLILSMSSSFFFFFPLFALPSTYHCGVYFNSKYTLKWTVDCGRIAIHKI